MGDWYGVNVMIIPMYGTPQRTGCDICKHGNTIPSARLDDYMKRRCAVNGLVCNRSMGWWCIDYVPSTAVPIMYHTLETAHVRGRLRKIWTSP